MPMPRFILHIGLEKTGTSSIQSFLAANRALLLEQHRVLYPDHPALFHGSSHVRIPASLMHSSKCEFLARSLVPDTSAVASALRSIANTDVDSVLLSAEHFSSRLDRPAVEQIGEWLQTYPVEILVYLRRQDEMAVSAFSTELRCGRRTWFRPQDITTSETYYNYQEILAPWADVFGEDKIRVRIFDPRRLEKGDVVEDFLDAIGIRTPSDWVHREPENQSINLAEASLLHLINGRLPTWDESVRRGRPREFQQAQEVRARVLSETANLPAFQQAPKLSGILSASDRAQILERFKESNESIARSYLATDRLFEGPTPTREMVRSTDSAPETTLSEEQLADLLTAMALRIHNLESLPLMTRLIHKAKRVAKRQLTAVIAKRA